jgi:hypothetical protein
VVAIISAEKDYLVMGSPDGNPTPRQILNRCYTNRVENDVSNNSTLVEIIRHLGKAFTETLPRKGREVGINVKTYKAVWKECMKYAAVEMGSVAMIYVRNFIQIGLYIQRLAGWYIYSRTDSRMNS